MANLTIFITIFITVVQRRFYCIFLGILKGVNQFIKLIRLLVSFQLNFIINENLVSSQFTFTHISDDDDCYYESHCYFQNSKIPRDLTIICVREDIAILQYNSKDC